MGATVPATVPDSVIEELSALGGDSTLMPKAHYFGNKIMRIRQYTLGLLLSLLVAAPALAATSEEKRVMDATDVLDQILRIPEQAIPPALLSRAYAVAVIPGVIKVGFGLGARFGKGILVVRNQDRSWSNPAFISLTGGSFGWQVGAQSTDIILVFKTRKGVDGITSGKFTLGADASIAAGPVGRQAGVATDWKFQSEVYSYSRNRGLFAGVALAGAGVSMDRKANAAYYGSANMSVEQIFASTGNVAPPSANNFVQVLTAQTAGLPMRPGAKSGVAATTPRQPPSDPPKSEVKTYGIPNGDGSF
jgi:lipid-binding SYLF domain-containing protein